MPLEVPFFVRSIIADQKQAFDENKQENNVPIIRGENERSWLVSSQLQYVHVQESVTALIASC